MCRVSAIKGNKFHNKKTIKLIEKLQDYGATIDAETVSDIDLSIIVNRFDITSSQFLKGGFPLQNDKYIFSYNGEVYSFRDKTYRESNAESDVHFAFDIINEFGHETFFKEADFEGTYYIYEKETSQLFVYVDQLNSKGCFYAYYNDSIIISQEYSIVNCVLKWNHIEKKIPINSVPKGHYLKVFKDNKSKLFLYKPNFKLIFQGSKENDNVNNLKNAIIKSVIDRIPKEGEFGVLSSGGVDSSIILKILTDHLKLSNSIERLKVFTLSSDKNNLVGEDNDLNHVSILLRDLELNYTNCFSKIDIDDDWKKYLLEHEVFNSPYRLITPNPAQTQVRHTVTMSCMLAKIVTQFPNLKVILTGDFADEIFGGYNSMHTGKLTELESNIQDKLDDLHLNDAARVTLSGLRGCKKLLRDYVKFEINHPIEIRTPYSSPIIADALKNVPSSFLIGKHKDIIQSKYILRLVAMKIGIPENISWRKKIPFNEGGTGVRNTEKDSIEELVAQKYIRAHSKSIGKININNMRNLRLNPESAFEKALFHSALQNGFDRLQNGNSFRKQMPDSNYSTKGSLSDLYKI